MIKLYGLVAVAMVFAMWLLQRPSEAAKPAVAPGFLDRVERGAVVCVAQKGGGVFSIQVKAGSVVVQSATDNFLPICAVRQ